MHMHNRMPTSNVHALFYHVTTIGTLINWLKCKIQLFKLQNNRFIYLGRCKGTFSLTMVGAGIHTKLDTNFDQHIKASESFYFELKVLIESKYSMPRVHCDFGNVWILCHIHYIWKPLFRNEFGDGVLSCPLIWILFHKIHIWMASWHCDFSYVL